MLDFVIFDVYNYCCNNNSITEGAKNMKSNLAKALNTGLHKDEAGEQTVGSDLKVTLGNEVVTLYAFSFENFEDWAYTKELEEAVYYSYEDIADKELLYKLYNITKTEDSPNICSICGADLDEYNGNNAYPVNTGQCCSQCNKDYVIPARLREVYHG